MNDNFYPQAILSNCPRLFSSVNQNQFSRNYGCLDRDFWHYKIEKDFPSSIFQTGALSLALLYKKRFPDNIYFGKKKTLDLAIAAISFWTKIQNAGGWFSEWFPNERSHVATAFTSYAVSEALLILDEDLPRELKKTTLNTLIKSGRWLSENPDKQVLNHTAGALLALYNLHLLTGKREFKKAAFSNLDILLNLQSEEGWFPEYGGADLGYLSLTVDFLAKYWQKTKDERALSSLKRAISFMSYFIHPDGSFGGEYGVRGTKFLIPAGLEVLSQEIPQAREILDTWVPFTSYDERYLIFFFLGNWIQAYLERKESKSKTKKDKLTEFEKDFRQAGILVKKTKNYYLIFSYKKNGVIKVFKGEKLAFSDTGWWGKLEDGRIVSSQWLNQEQVGLPVRAQFCHVREPWLGEKVIFFRLFNYTVGKFGIFSRLFEHWVKRKHIVSVETVPIFFKRKLSVGKSKISVEDKISLGEGIYLSSLRRTSNLSQRYTPTSLFFTPSDLLEEKGKDFAKAANKKREIKVKRRI